MHTMKLWAFCAIIVFTLVHVIHADTCKGCLNLDEHSFNKIVPRFSYSLIKYDIAYPYGAKHDAFVQFADELINVKDVVVGEIGIKDYGQKENEEFAKTQHVDSKKLPVIKLYKNAKEAVTFLDDDVTVEKLREFVLQNSDIHITLPGCLEALDKLALQFAKEDTKGQKKLLKDAEDFKPADEAEQKIAKTYLVYMRKVLDDPGFVGKERKRLKKILAEGKVAEAKKLDLQHKLNILHTFKHKNDDTSTPKADL